MQDNLALLLKVIIKKLYAYNSIKGNRLKCFNWRGRTEQVNEIRRVKLSRVICDNSDHIETVQVYVMVLPDAEM